MSLECQSSEVPYIEMADDMDPFLGMDLDFDNLYPTPPLPVDELTVSEQRVAYTHAIRSRAALACVQCRSRHLKCDGLLVCSRCQADTISCVYTKSRRGGKRRQNIVKTTHALPIDTGSSERARTIIHVAESLAAVPQPVNQIAGTDSVSNSHSITHTALQRRSKRLELYYERFHNSHPFLLPHHRLRIRMRDDPDLLHDLILVMECIGSVYQGDGSLNSTKQAAHDRLRDRNLPPNGFSVQSLLLYAMAVHYFDDHESAETVLSRAAEIALSIGMFSQDYATANGQGDPILEESWRRTAWFLFNIDAVFAAIRHQPAHRLQNVRINVDLPCEDHEYEIGNIPTPRTLTDYDNRDFEEDETVYSSFAYFIDAGRIVSDTLTITQQCRDPNESKLHAADTKILSWFLHLPKCKQEITNESRGVDETMFLAHLWINTEKLLLHRPYSQLQYHSVESSSRCTPIAQTRDSSQAIGFHTSKTLEAIEDAFKLFALPSPQPRHSPIVTCSLALFIMAQVSACANIFQLGDDDHAEGRQRVRLGLGVLKGYKTHWRTANRSENEVKVLAKQLLTNDTAGH